MGIERASTEFLRERLDLASHKKNYVIIRARHRLHFLGMWIYPAGRSLNERNLSQIKNRLSIRDIPSYSFLLKPHLKASGIEAFQLDTLEKLEKV